jgi:hypothetical protein
MHALRLVHILVILLLCIDNSKSVDPIQKVRKAHAIKLKTMIKFRINKT